MTTVRTNAAAAMLGVSPNTLRSWERRFGFPTPRRTAGGHRQFDLARDRGAAAGLRADAQRVLGDPPRARARSGPGVLAARLRSALARFDEERGRPGPRGEPRRALGRADGRGGPAARRRAHRRARGRGADARARLRAGAGRARGSPPRRRVAPPASREEGVLIFDACRPPDIDALHAQALELLLRRAGVRALCIDGRLRPRPPAAALGTLSPRAVVLAGRGAPLDVLGRARLRRAPVGHGRRRLRLPRRAAGERRVHRAAPRPQRARRAGRAHRAPRREGREPRGAVAGRGRELARLALYRRDVVVCPP